MGIAGRASTQHHLCCCSEDLQEQQNLTKISFQLDPLQIPLKWREMQGQ